MTIEAGAEKRERLLRVRLLLQLSCGYGEMSFVLFPRDVVDDGCQGARGDYAILIMRRNLLIHHQRGKRSIEAG